MIYVIKLLLNWLQPNKIIKVYWQPGRTKLNWHCQGLTLGLIAALLFICLNYSQLFQNLPGTTSFLFGIVFILGTFIRRFFIILGFIFLTVFILLSPNPAASLDALLAILNWYIVAYVFGAIFAILYNDISVLLQYVFNNNYGKIVFAFDPKKKFNIIKSPVEREELAMLEVIKPMTYYTQQILLTSENTDTDGKNRQKKAKNIQKVTSLIMKTYQSDQITSVDRNKMMNHLQSIIGRSDNFETLLSELGQKLQSENKAGLRETIEKVETHIEPVVEKYQYLKKQKFFNYKLESLPAHPYTIAFIANPKIMEPKTDKETASISTRDPIMDNKFLFLEAVAKAMYSFASNEVLGRPEIWSRIRIIAIFDEQLAKKPGDAFALLEPYPEGVTIDDAKVTNMIAPRENMWDNYRAIITQEYSKSITGFHVEDENKPDLNSLIDETDVLFALSADLRFTRSTATSTLFNVFKGDDHSGEAFSFDFDPDSSKHYMDENGNHVEEVLFPTYSDKGKIRENCAQHEYYADIPGRVALNVFGANYKTYIHEFAHAMSSWFNGYIADEYFDELTEENPGIMINGKMIIPFCINRIERIKPSSERRAIPVHKIFAKYNNNYYDSDRVHPTANETWLGYFPGRKSPFTRCIMDRLHKINLFDDLIQDFMYDRLFVKFNRKKR